MLLAQFHDFFIAAAGTTGALIGLLFVAVTVAPERLREEESALVAQIHAATALVCFTDVLGVSLFALIPQDGVGYPAISFAIPGLAFAAAAARSLWSAPGERRGLGIAIGLFILFGLQITFSIEIIVRHHAIDPVENLCAVLIAALLVGIARSWQLVGLRGTGIVHSMRTLLRGD
jgi:hypothetical protein